MKYKINLTHFLKNNYQNINLAVAREFVREIFSFPFNHSMDGKNIIFISNRIKDIIND